LTILQELNHPSLGICLDVANSIVTQEWPRETIGLLAPYAINLHLKDYRIVLDPYGVGFSVVGAPLGQGRMDVPAVFEALSAAGKDVNMILEHWLPIASTPEETFRLEDAWLAQSVQTARQFISR
jgi:3-oxoisoapionate decarboxylase